MEENEDSTKDKQVAAAKYGRTASSA